MRAIRLFDEVEIGLCANEAHNVDPPSINITANIPDIPKDQRNLAWQAADLAVKELSGGTLDGRIEININKNIPIAAGLGGGSSDAAVVLLWAAKILAPETRMSDLTRLGEKIGADVPFFLYACAAANPALGYKGMSSALAEGAGELLTALSETEKAYIVLVKPDIKINTKDVYALYDTSTPLYPASGNDPEKPDAGSFDTQIPVSDNDLEEPCAGKWPVVAETVSVLRGICEAEGAGKAKVQMSGSGPTVFAYFGEDLFGPEACSVAERVYERAKTRFPDSFVHLTETL
jgi:4-diphosphocytidyl-2-C-methyl-D-erythritol kinase